MTFFTDRNLGNVFPATLREAGLTVERHDDHFAQNTPDEEWLESVGRRGWLVITRDRRIRYRPNERDAVMKYGVAMLVLLGKARSEDLARSFVATLPRIERFAATHEPPWIAKVFRPTPTELAKRPEALGRVELWYPAA